MVTSAHWPFGGAGSWGTIPRNGMGLLPEFVLDHLPDPVYAANMVGTVLYANRATCRSLQYQRNEIQKLSLWEIDMAFEAARWDAKWSLIRENKEMQTESRLKRRDGTTFPVEVTRTWDKLTPSEGKQAEILVVSARDVAYRTEDVERTVQRVLRLRVIRQLDEQDVRLFRMLEQGASETEITQELGISRSTYYRIKRRITTKLGIEGSDFNRFWWESKE